MAHSILSKISLPPVVLSDVTDKAYTDFKSSWFDMSGYEGAVILVTVGVLTGVDGSNTVLPILYEHDTTADSGATAVAAADIEGAFTLIDSTTKDSVVQAVVYRGSKRYVGVNMDYTGTGISAGYVGVEAFGCYPLNTPNTTTAAVART